MTNVSIIQCFNGFDFEYFVIKTDVYFYKNNILDLALCRILNEIFSPK